MGKCMWFYKCFFFLVVYFLFWCFLDVCKGRDVLEYDFYFKMRLNEKKGITTEDYYTEDYYILNR